MLSPEEFTVGTFADAAPLSLILPRNEDEIAALIGTVSGVATAVILEGRHAFHALDATASHNWTGAIVPNVRVEVDETSLFAADQQRVSIGSVLRTDTKLLVGAKREHRSSGTTAVTLYDGLAHAGTFGVGFRTWQVVIGEGPFKRVLWHSSAVKTDTKKP